MRMLDIPQDIFDRAYNNVANSALWFVHHMLFDTPNQPQFGLEFRHDWDSYVTYNEAFADALAREAGRGPVPPGGVRALIQDYHLSLAPRMLRERLGGAARDVGIAHFSHTPWAPPDYYRMLPERGRPRRAGRHARRGPRRLPGRPLGRRVPATAARRSSARTWTAAAGGRTARRVSYRDHVTEVAVHPLGVDAPALRARAQADDVHAHIETLGRRQPAAG